MVAKFLDKLCIYTYSQFLLSIWCHKTFLCFFGFGGLFHAFSYICPLAVDFRLLGPLCLKLLNDVFNSCTYVRPVHTCAVCHVVSTARGQVNTEINYDTLMRSDHTQAEHLWVCQYDKFLIFFFLNFDILIEKCNRNWSNVRKKNFHQISTNLFL